jgi:hypothetical protein
MAAMPSAPIDAGSGTEITSVMSFPLVGCCHVRYATPRALSKKTIGRFGTGSAEADPPTNAFAGAADDDAIVVQIHRGPDVAAVGLEVFDDEHAAG